MLHIMDGKAMTIQHHQSGLFVGEVVGCRTPCPEHFEISLAVEGFPHAIPGQFVQVRCCPLAQNTYPEQPHEDIGALVDSGNADLRPMLRRPFSIAGLRRTGTQCEIDILGRVVGVGTGRLATLVTGDVVDILGPLGRGFSAALPDKRVLLVAGGVGLAPIRWLGEKLRRDGMPCDSIYGARTRGLLPVALTETPSKHGALTLCVEAFAREGIRTAITTDDGTCGMRGRVTDRMVSYFDGCGDPSSIQVYACGPEPMLRAVGSLCVSRGIWCELALERMMGCGVGACQSCVVRVVDASSAEGWRYALCCTDGPVFDAAGVIWFQ